MQVALREIAEDEAKRLLSDIESRDPSAWSILFGEDGRAGTWTAVALSNFRDMYKKLQTGVLRRVLSAALPMRTDFAIRMNGNGIPSSKLNLQPIHTVSVAETVPGVVQATVVKPGGEVVMVVGNSFLRGAVIDNAGIVESLAESVGFRRVEQAVRKIPARRRYLSPPNMDGENALDFRIREETTLTFVA